MSGNEIFSTGNINVGVNKEVFTYDEIVFYRQFELGIMILGFLIVFGMKFFGKKIPFLSSKSSKKGKNY